MTILQHPTVRARDLDNAIEAFFFDLEHANRSPHTRRAYASDLAAFHRCYPVPLGAITADTLRDYFAPLSGFILHGYREEMNGMLAGIRRCLARFWYGPTGAPGATTIFPHEASDEDRAWMEEANRVTEEIYWFQRREEDDDRDEHRQYDL